jgi:exodeoxyribonuclease V alpha subunit
MAITDASTSGGLDAILQATRRRHVLRERLIQSHGSEGAALAAIREDPYAAVLTIPGAGWLSADAIGRAVGCEKDHPGRLSAAIGESMRQAETWGHCWHAPKDLVTSIIDMTAIDAGTAMRAIQQAVDGGDIHTSDGERLYVPKLHGAEERLVAAVARIMADGPKGLAFDCDGLVDSGLHADQQDAVHLAASAPLTIVTGPPGSGKTFMLHAILSRFVGVVELMAPTGRAAKRMSESTDRPATTIHRALEPKWKHGGGFEFTRDEIDADLIVIDEASMLSLSLAAALFKRVRSGSRVLLIGDPNQLPAVGPGDVLRDMIRSDAIPVAELRTIKRQDDALIVRACHQVLHGEVPRMPAPGHGDLAFIDAQTDREASAVARGLIENRAMLEKYGGADDITGVQIISPRRKKGSAISCTEMNAAVWRELHPLTSGTRWQRPAVGDKVMQTRNNYQINRAAGGVMNGDLGCVVRANRSEIVVRIDGDLVSAKPSAWDLDHAWATTIHKGQGSEWPVVIVVMHESAGGMLLTRQLLYTAMSRARNLCVVVGTKSAVGRAVRNDREEKRRTGWWGRSRRSAARCGTTGKRSGGRGWWHVCAGWM